MRLGEVLALQWGDLDRKKRALSVQRAAQEVGGYVEIGPTKTRTSRRRIDLGSMALAALQQRRKAAEEGRAAPTDLIFPTLSGLPMRRSNLYRSHFSGILKTAKLTGVRVHDLRHFMASIALSQGVPAKVVSERLGHSTTRLAVDRYTHVLPGLQREAARAIDGALRAGRGK